MKTLCNFGATSLPSTKLYLPAIVVQFQACDMLNKGATRVWETQQLNPYLYTADGVWLGYDDKESLGHKVNSQPICPKSFTRDIFRFLGNGCT